MSRLIFSFILGIICWTSCSSDDIFEEMPHKEARYVSAPTYPLKDTSTINILIFGNSFSRDAFSYLPFILERCVDSISVNIDILQIGGVSLNTHYDNIKGDNPGFVLDSYNSEDNLWTSTPETKASDVVPSKDWDLVILQEGRVNARNYSSMTQTCSGIKEYILQYCPTTLFAFMTNPAFPEGSESISKEGSDIDFECLTDNSFRIMDEGIVDLTIPCGTAIQRARHTYLDSIGNFGHFSYDGRHLQEGLPCLIEAYTAAETIMRLFGLEGTVSGNPLKVTQNWAVSKKIPGRHGVVIEGTEFDYFVCQQCAIYAAAHPFTYDNIQVRKKYPELFTLYDFNIEAHRGFSREYPENTELAFIEAGKIPQFKGIETDVQMTKDGVLVCIHDRTLERTTTGTGNVKDYTYDQLMEMDINGGFGWNDKYEGQLKIPTFEQYLDVCSLYHKTPYVELKSLSKEGIKRTIDMLHWKGFKDGSFVLISFNKGYLTYASNLCHTPLEYMQNSFTDDGIEELAALDDFVIRPTCSFVTEDFVKKCDEKGLLIECFAMNANDFSNLFLWGVAGGTSDTWTYYRKHYAETTL